MVFNPISIREAMNKIHQGDWVLPMTQRPYEWGDRFDFKKVIYKIFDSLYRNYPIGAFLIWKTTEKIPYREFSKSFNPDSLVPRAIESGNWDKLKYLVYDGQQRLQTIYSCLKHDFDHDALCFDLLFDPNKYEDGETGFVFFETYKKLKPKYLKLTNLYKAYGQENTNVSRFRKEMVQRLTNLTDDQVSLVESNIDTLWNLFNNEENEICGYFMISQKSTPKDVQEIFVRLNTGGLPPSQADLVFSLIHVEFFDFQNRIQEVSAEIQEATGIDVDSYDILQFLYYIKFNTNRIDVKKLKREEIKEFENMLENIIDPLKTFYKRFLHDEFQINNSLIYRSQIALLPLLLFFYKKKLRGLTKIPKSEMEKVKQYFILSQINDWSTAGIISEAGRLVMNNSTFPLKHIKKYVPRKNKLAKLTEEGILSNSSFVLKILIPKKAFTHIKSRGRLNPEIEHIFPKTPKESDLPPDYHEAVRLLWNLQLGVPGDLNIDKGNLMPNIYFKNKKNELKKHYDFLPTYNINNGVWDYHNLDLFLSKRKKIIYKEFKKLYKLKISKSGE
jgi:uncharacterized protein with ParB-like and HNH nuclease domain